MNIFLINILVALFCIILGYFFGSIPTAVWVGKIFFHQDPRQYGSKNAGGTNAGRLWGKKVGFLIIVLDMLKTVLPVYLCWILLTYIKFDYSVIDGVSSFSHALLPTAKQLYTPVADGFAIRWAIYWLAAVGVILGHCWPIFAGFKGGKGVSCFMGTTVVSSWMLGFIPGFCYFGFLKWKKYVSLASILQSILITTLTWIWVVLVMTKVIPQDLCTLPMYGPSLFPDFTYACVVTFMAGLLIIRHHGNIARLRAGTERKIKWMK